MNRLGQALGRLTVLPSNSHLRIASCACCVIMSLLHGTSLAAQGNPEIVRGRVSDSTDKPVVGAAVSVTGEDTRTVRRTTTNAAGEYRVVFILPERRYSVLVRLVGYGPGVSTTGRSSGSNTVVADFVLARAAFALAPIVTTAGAGIAANTPERTAIGATTVQVLHRASVLFDPSDLASIAQLAIGTQVTGDNSFSIMGNSPEQNRTTIDGMTFEGSSLPPDAMCSAALTTTTSDPSRGQFGGGVLSIQSCRGQDFRQGTIRTSLVDPKLTWADPASPIPDSRVFTVSGFAAGPLVTGSSRYRASLIGSQRTTMSSDLLTAKSALLSQFGVGSDSVQRLATILTNFGIPLSAPGISGSTRTGNVNAFVRGDFEVGTATSLMITANGVVGWVDGSGLRPLSFSTQSGMIRSHAASTAIRASTYLFGGINEATIALDSRFTRTSPYSELPSASVGVGSSFGNDRFSIAALGFAGSSNLSSISARSIAIRDEFRLANPVGDHRLSLGFEGRISRESVVRAADSLGTFSFQSLDDLAAGLPSSYHRLIGARSFTVSSESYGFWVADTWRATRRLTLGGGARMDLDGSAFPGGDEPRIDSLFERASGTSGRSVAISPRVGFAWLVKRIEARMGRNPFTGQPSLVFTPSLMAEESSGVPRGNTGLGVTLFGSIGAYRGVKPRSLLERLASRTAGLNGPTSLSCVGDATPVPAWGRPGGTIFSSCRTVAGEGFAQPLVDVEVPSVSFRPPTNWKADLGLTGVWWKRWNFTSSVIVQREVDRESRSDLNLQAEPAFTLPNEGNRPVFASPDFIAPRSGLIPLGASRRFGAYGTVMETRSDLDSRAVQLNLTIRTPDFGTQYVDAFTIGYSYNASSHLGRGLDGSTAGDPRTIDRTSGSAPLHQLQVLSPELRLGPVAMRFQLDVFSGLGFTPAVASDVNGDGYANDRAFVPVPARLNDTALAAGLRSLLASAPLTARSCLESQMGKVAAANSCRGPWRANLGIMFELNPRDILRFDDRLHFRLTAFNLGSPILRLLGVGSSNVSSQTPIDSRLLFVDGFDVQTRQFRYRVNQAFGQPLQYGALGGWRSPVQLRLEGEYQFSRRRGDTWIKRWGIDPKSAVVHDRAAVLRALRAVVGSPPDTILALRDPLQLSAAQVVLLEGISARFGAVVDSVLRPIVDIVVERGSRVSDADIVTPMRNAGASLSPARLAARDEAVAQLSEAQVTQFIVIQSKLSGLPRAGIQ